MGFDLVLDIWISVLIISTQRQGIAMYYVVLVVDVVDV